MKFSRTISKTRLKVRVHRKTNPAVAETIALASKSSAWTKYAKMLSISTRKHASINLGEIDKQTSAGDTVMVVGKVLSLGDVSKKIRICSFAISSEALEKLKKTKSEWIQISDEIKKNPKAEGIKLIR